MCYYAHCFILINVTTEIKPDRLVIHDGRHFLTVFNEGRSGLRSPHMMKPKKAVLITLEQITCVPSSDLSSHHKHAYLHRHHLIYLGLV